MLKIGGYLYQMSRCLLVSAFALGHAPMEMSPNFPPEIPPSMILEENIAKHNQHEHMQVSYTTAYQHEDSVIQQAQSQTSLTDKVPVGEKLHQSLNAVELLSIEVPAVSDTSTVPGNPCDSTFLDDVSVEASGLRQLLWIMKQLDSRTKLCIRDSLYRLARSADQRHNLGLSKSSGRDIINEKGVFTTEEANVSSELKDLEAVTNPIDRSVAHLLFQVPAKPATGVCDGSLSLESSSVVQGAITSQHLIPYELLYEEKHSGGVEEISEY
ncbi:protein LNK2-like isoform X3 [Papaver somniferum]|uniref:protein LNK2-like isoform X3 n=1 Tax=Papaver somniferum TaxID=3469 RepID=UPI000E6FC0AB|nr:protein LNK2-like isoform X3 [Papaver somniferum]